MIEMKIEKVISFASLCGIEMDPSQSISNKEFSQFMKKIPEVRYIAYCLKDKSSLLLAKKLIAFQMVASSFRIVAIGNNMWYSNLSIDTQNVINKTKSQADIFAQCSFPIEDADTLLSLFCEYVCYISRDNKINILKTDSIKT